MLYDVLVSYWSSRTHTPQTYWSPITGMPRLCTWVGVSGKAGPLGALFEKVLSSCQLNPRLRPDNSHRLPTLNGQGFGPNSDQTFPLMKHIVQTRTGIGTSSITNFHPCIAFCNVTEYTSTCLYSCNSVRSFSISCSCSRSCRRIRLRNYPTVSSLLFNSILVFSSSSSAVCKSSLVAARSSASA